MDDESFTQTLIRGEIRIGSEHQAEIPQTLEAQGKIDERVLKDLETLVYQPENGLTEKEIDQYLIIAKSVGTFARVLDYSSSVKQPSIHMTAAAASRDITLAHAMNVLHQNDYDIGKAVLSLVPPTGPVLCRDEMEEWSAAEANLFEMAMEKYGKDFHEIRQDFLSWKSMRSIIEFYYMWKTTERCLQRKRMKVAEAENRARLMQMQNLNQNQPVIGNNGTIDRLNSTNKKFTEFRNFPKLNSNHDIIPRAAPAPIQATFPCNECDHVSLSQERLIAHLNYHKLNRVTVAKEMRPKSQSARHPVLTHEVAIRAGSSRRIMMKTRAAFYLQTTSAAKLARRLCSQIIRIKHAARSPFAPINVALIKQECQLKLAEGAVTSIPNFKPINRGKIIDISQRLGTPLMDCPEWLILKPKSQQTGPRRLAFPPPSETEKDGLFFFINKRTRKINRQLIVELRKAARRPWKKLTDCRV
ncbi:metastasis-associated protein MTA1-like [Panonychus citri]|uniref:metastasis-associated protein MTA1-like n=1 Tax=Panonychus citri TaxID=50023 RepID=UPI002307F321|nr:metastasis-associated protein MTA1-like [Panonychus citri]